MRKIIIGIILTIFLMMMLPTVPAIEYNTAVKSNESRIIDKIYNLYETKIRKLLQKTSIYKLKEKILKSA